MKLYILTTMICRSSVVDSVAAYIDDSDTPQIVRFDRKDLQRIGFYSRTVVTYAAHDLFDCLRHHGLDAPRSSVDLLQMYKLYKGKPIKYHRFRDDQILWNLVADFLPDEKERIRDLFLALKDGLPWFSCRHEFGLLELTRVIKGLYIPLVSGLAARNELDRFQTVEQPLNDILLRTQYHGIRIDLDLLLEKVENVENDIRVLDKRLRFQYNLTSIKNRSELRKVLRNNGFAYLAQLVGTKHFWRLVKPCSKANELLSAIFSRFRLSQERDILIRVAVGQDTRIFPVYDCNGSVTSRVLVRRPYVQQLRRSSRDIFVADPGYSLVYVDYGHFEPSIVASETEDEQLIEFANGHDIYSSLSQELFATNEYRELSKVVVLCFIYGMSEDGLRFLMKDYFRGAEVDMKKTMSKVSMKFKALFPYRQELEDSFLVARRVGTLMGNYRYASTSNGSPEDLNFRWVLSQRIQGTASLILKNAILASCADDEIRFMFPMHDAALFQVPTDKVNSKKKIIKTEFQNSFLAVCPRVTPKVHFKGFHE